ncbi:MAG: hypothetical protein P9M14_17490 [Candidatus Alcyoniella australis]|nr:hypothetical protein [Candidatus Alcyoniella australis]
MKQYDCVQQDRRVINGRRTGERLAWALAVVCLLWTVGACSDQREGTQGRGAGTACDGGPCVREIALQAGLNEPRDPAEEFADYLRFTELAADHARPIPPKGLGKIIDRCLNGTLGSIAQRVDADQLRAVLLHELNIGFLVQGIEQRPLTVAASQPIEHPNYLERRLVFDDPFVGRFRALLLRPREAGPHSAIIARHGHRDDESTFVELYGGRRLAEAGFVVLVLQSRICGADELEDRTARLLLGNGFTLIGLRCYESLLALRYLEQLQGVDNGRIGLVGHSGGSVVNNLTARIDPRFKAVVIDCPGRWVNVINGRIVDETAPGLYPYRKQLNDFSSIPTQTLVVPYGYAEQVEDMVEFLQDEL